MRPSLVALTVATASIALPVRALAQTAPPTPPAPETAAPTPPAAPPAAPAAPSSGVDVTTLDHLRDRGILSQAEYELALRDIGASTGDTHAAEAGSLVFGKWATTLYGFIEGDTIFDSTQSFTDAAGNNQVLRPTGNTAPLQPTLSGVTQQPVQATQGYLGSHGQTQFSVRNSRLGLRLRAPGSESVHASAMVEMDFLGNQPPGVSQSSFFTSPTMRLRHAMFRVETPVVDFLVGQYWQLFGWQGSYQPNTVEIQGVPGQLYARAPQVRISKSFRGDLFTFEMAVAAARPPAGSEVPEVEGGVRLAVNKWAGMHTAGATGTSIHPLSIAVTGDYRKFQIPQASTLLPSSSVGTQSGAIAADVFIPVIPASEGKRGNSLSLIGEFVTGSGISDMYAGMNSGVMFPFIVNDTTGQLQIPWPGNVDQGLVAYDINPGGFALHPIQWTSFLAGLEYYLPGLDGKVWISGNYSHIQSQNSGDFARNNADQPSPLVYFFLTTQSQVRKSEDWWDANVFVDPLPSVRIGAEFAQFIDHYVDGFTATNNRVQLSGFFLF